jgi:hypothetical protein
MFCQVAKRGCRQLRVASRRSLATSRQKRALDTEQLGVKAGAAKDTSKLDPPVAGGSATGGRGSALPAILALVGAGGAGAYYMDMLPDFLSSSAPETPSLTKKEEAPVVAEPKKEENKKPKESKKKYAENKQAVAKKKTAKAEEPKSTKPAGNRVLNIALPQGSTRSTPPAAITGHPIGGNKVSMNPAKKEEDASNENRPSVDAALKELQRQLSKGDSTRSLVEAHKDLASLTSMDLSDLDQMSITQLKIRLVQMTKDMEERTKWEAVRLKEFLMMKEKEVEDK